MAAYPAFGQLDDSEEIVLDGLIMKRASNGAARGRLMYTGKKRGFNIKHILTAAEKATLETFYDTNRALTFDFVWKGDSMSRTCLFTPDAPRFIPVAGYLWRAEVPMEEV